MEIFNDLLTKNDTLLQVSKSDLPLRRKIIFDEIFTRVYVKVTNSLLAKDRLIFALRLA